MAAGSGARRYAEALLDIATEEHAVAAYRESLDAFATGLDPGNIRGLRDQRGPFDRRPAARDAGIARAFGGLVDRREGIAKAKITTPVEIVASERDELVRRLEQASGKKIRATFEVGPALIGGARVQVGDRLIDASLQTRLEHLAR